MAKIIICCLITPMQILTTKQQTLHFSNRTDLVMAEERIINSADRKLTVYCKTNYKIAFTAK